MSNMEEKGAAQVVFNADADEKQQQSENVLSNDSLPQPVSTPAKGGKLKLSAAMIIPIWIVLSSSVII